MVLFFVVSLAQPTRTVLIFGERREVGSGRRRAVRPLIVLVFPSVATDEYVSRTQIPARQRSGA